MFESICSLPLAGDIFTQAVHPSRPIVAVGLSTGHVEVTKLPPVAGEDDSDHDDAASASDKGLGLLETSWRTRRHKGSARAVRFSLDGRALYSAGSDGLMKAADSETGEVFSKIAIPDDDNGILDAPTLMHILSPQSLLLSTDSSALHLFDLRVDDRAFAKNKPQQTWYPHEDYISSLTPLPPSETSTSGFSRQWVTTGGTTLAVTDIRRGVLVKSEDQGEELLSSEYVGGFAKKGTSQGEKVLVGGGDGVITLWEKGVWDDQDERIILDKGGEDSIDALTRIPEELGMGKTVVAGMSNGCLALVKLGINKVVDVLKHDEVEGVAAIDFEVGGRMISGGGPILKVWREKMRDDEEDIDVRGVKKRNVSDNEADSDDSDDEHSSEEEREEQKRRKKRKKGKGINGFSKNKMFSGLD
ncbi:uncharacterized protein PV09_02186 [Verruconis gallopava]|uniref:WD repeat-containing protein JIP5 n=1 Tax=Verruconis gallopava TaxID=253628 RepID=A0A0D1Z313_9PEZI|nr:uncharacterized protein PV09_02186 [Verruconis gallopava]KIW07337.1 hypothetical protein PV09_02186 [Verruconis gallopava]